MSRRSRAVSLVAERALRYLRDHPRRVNSVEMARGVLATSVRDEVLAKTLLESAFAGDPRLAYEDGAWNALGAAAVASRPAWAARPADEPHRVLILIQGARVGPRRPFALRSVAAIRLEGDTVIAACGGDSAPGRAGEQLRRAVLELIEGAVPVLFEPVGALPALETWLQERLVPPILLRRLAQLRLGLPAGHSLADLASKLGLSWRETEDPMDLAEALEGCVEALRRPGETLDEMRLACLGGKPAIDWSRYAFDREFLRGLPQAPGVYRFHDARGKLLYVGKSKDLRRRVSSYFVEGASRTPRVQALLDGLHRIEVEPSGSDLEAMLREASLISRRKPSRNVQREVHAEAGRAARLRSMMILEPAEPPVVLWAYFVRDAELVDKVGIGPKGRGLKRVERILEDHFFVFRPGPAASRPVEVDVDLIARWLAAHRDRAVAFDPTDLPSAREVVLRLEWFLKGGALSDPGGAPGFPR